MSDDTIISSIDGVKDDGEKKPHLTFIKGPNLGQIFELNRPETVVGRLPECDLCIEDNAISRRHFRILQDGEKLVVEDMGSTNGTYINGDRLQSSPLNDGDKIQISQDTILELTYLDQTRLLSEKKRYEMGVLDPVTNIYNKRYFMERLKEEFAFAKRRRTPLSLMILDIDFFKRLNDTYGHLAGDQALQKVSAEINAAIRSDDIFARYGGEEFVVLMREASLKNAYDLAERIRKIVEAMKIPYEGQEITMTISSGVATISEKIEDPISLIADADRYLYRSKKQGRNRVSGPSLEPDLKTESGT